LLVTLFVGSVILQAQVQVQDPLKVIQATKSLDGLKQSDVKPETHEKSKQEKLAESPRSVFVGRDTDALTHPTILSKVPKRFQGAGKIAGQPVLCNYLLDATLGVDLSSDVHGDRLYTTAARLECEWASCRLCQQRIRLALDYCTRNGQKDWLLRGICEDKNPLVEHIRLAKMAFNNNPTSCRLWKDMQVLQNRCSPADVAFCQGAYDFGEICHSLGLDSKKFLQGKTLDSVAAWFCQVKASVCPVSYFYYPSDPQGEVFPHVIGNEVGALGLD